MEGINLDPAVVHISVEHIRHLKKPHVIHAVPVHTDPARNGGGNPHQQVLLPQVVEANEDLPVGPAPYQGEDRFSGFLLPRVMGNRTVLMGMFESFPPYAQKIMGSQ